MAGTDMSIKPPGVKAAEITFRSRVENGERLLWTNVPLGTWGGNQAPWVSTAKHPAASPRLAFEVPMRCFPFLPAIASAALMLGCGDPPRVTAPDDPPAPSLGAQRFVFVNAFLMGGDPSNPLVLQAGYDAGVTPADICADPFNQNFNGVGQIVITPPGGGLVHTSGRDVNLVVYAFGAGPVADACQVVGAPVVGSGTGKFSFVAADPNPGALAVSVTVQGIVDLVSGGQARVLGTARITVLGDGTVLFDEERVTLTPL